MNAPEIQNSNKTSEIEGYYFGGIHNTTAGPIFFNHGKNCLGEGGIFKK